VTRRSDPVVRAAPLRALLQRFAYLALVGAAVAMMLIGKIETVVVEEVRARVTDSVAPILDAMSRPIASARQFADHLRELAVLRDENIRLREENARLLQWRLAARRLEGENKALRDLLNFDPGPGATFVSGRAIADSGGAFVRSVLINVGARDGVRRHQAVVTGEGLIGRIVTVGDRSARVLLITDLNSKIPVVVGEARERAILSGDNSAQPALLYIEQEEAVKAGDHVVTSGHGGMFPPGLPVGVVAVSSGRSFYVQPYVEWHRLEFVRVVDYGAAGASGTLNPD